MSDSSSESESELLEALQRQCAASLGLPVSSNKRRKLSVEPEEDNVEVAEDEEWTGFSDSDEEQEMERTVTFIDPSRRSAEDSVDAAGDYRSFMSASVSKQLQPSTSQKPVTAKEEAEEVEMRKLDSTLQQLIATLPSSDFTSSSDRIKTTTIQKNTPLPLRRALQQAHISRLKTQAESDRASSRITSKSASKPHQKVITGVALTKTAMRHQTGQEAKRKRDARGIGSNLGTFGKSGLRFSKEEIERTKRGESAQSRPSGSQGKRKR